MLLGCWVYLEACFTARPCMVRFTLLFCARIALTSIIITGAILGVAVGAMAGWLHEVSLEQQKDVAEEIRNN